MAAVFPASHVVVVGGGLAGMAAANQVLECGGRVVVLDKSSFCGGNSTRSTSGICAAGTSAQQVLGVEDSVEAFIEDTLRSGSGKPELARVLCVNSAPAVQWLVDKFDLDLSVVSRLGGHSQPRTHRGKERLPGMTITYALIQMVEKMAEVTDRARIVTKAEVFRLLFRNGIVVGCEYRKGQRRSKEYGPVILACGGYGADAGRESVLARCRPDLLPLPTTSGEHSTGDAIRMAEAVGAKAIDLEWVQVHPTGLVNPADPDAKIKIIGAEALRGAGGLLVDSEGGRFCNELGPRGHVVEQMGRRPPPFRLLLNGAASREILWHCRYYVGRGVMRHFATGAELARDMGIPLGKLEEVHEAHFQAAERARQAPDGGPWPAYPSGSSWDEPSGRSGSGKRFFCNAIRGSAVASEPFYAAIVTPAIHYCMGGLAINESAQVLREDGAATPGLYAAGEAAAGAHGREALGGSALLDCVVFGRVAAKAACAFAFGEDDEFRPCPLPD